jgi:hypothetical protein
VVALGTVSACTAALLAIAVPVDRWAFAVMLMLIQLAFVAGWASLFDIPGPGGAVGIPAAAVVLGDCALLSGNGVSLTSLATVLGFVFLATLVWQIARPHRTRVVESLAVTVSGVVLALGGGAFITLRASGNGENAVSVALLGVVAVLGVGRTMDAVAPEPSLAGLSRRGVPGLVAGLASALVVGTFYGAQLVAMTVGQGIAIAFVAAAVAAATDIGLEVGLGTLGSEPGRRSAPWPARLAVAATLPILLAAPATYVVARVVLP